MEAIGTGLIFGYLSLSLLVGVLAGRKQTPEGFLLGERKVGGFSTFATLAASKTGGGFFLTIVAVTYLYGAGVLGYVLGLVVGFIAFYFFSKKRLKDQSDKYQFYTLADYVFHSYGKAAGYLAAFLSFSVLCGSIVIQLTAGSKTVFEITGISYGYSLLLISLVVLIYLLAGGFKAVVKTDILQYLAIIITVVFIVFAFVNFSGGVKADYLSVGEAGWLNALLFIIFGLITPFFSSELYQRVYATESQKTLKKSFLLSIIIYPLVALAVVFMGLMIRTHLPGIDPETAFIRGLIDLLPSFFLGIGGVLMFSAIMSSADTYVFTNTSIILQDFLLRNRKISKERLVFYFRITMALLVAIGIIVSFLLKSLLISTYFWGSLGCILSTGIIASWLFKKLSPFALSLGFSLGILTFIAVAIISRVALEPITVGSCLGGTILGLGSGSILHKYTPRGAGERSPG